jgi:propanol-preferring alcohol dehydrogenase
MTTMQIAMVAHFREPLVLREWNIPTPKAGQIFVKTEVCEVCHPDVHAAEGDRSVKPQRPCMPGHEGIGRVSAIGAGVTLVKETVCPEETFTDYDTNGSFAEYLLADANYVAPIPDGILPQDAAPIICTGITSYKAIKQTEAKPGEWLAVSGIGGPWHLAIQYAKHRGLKVCAVDIDDGKLALAKSLGAEATINAKGIDPVAEVKKATDGGIHGVRITAPSLPAFKQGVGNREDLAEALKFAVEGKVEADIERQSLAAITEVFRRLEHGDVPGRVVLQFP